MIGPGWLPRPRPVLRRWRPTLAYTGRRARRPGRAQTSARSEPAVNTEIMLFDQVPAELPVARVQSRAWYASLGDDARRWLHARWRWLAPRTVPVTVALIGMIAMIASAHYLSNLATAPLERMPAPVLVEPDQLASMPLEIGSLTPTQHAP